MTEVEAINVVAEKYRQDGYAVDVDPHDELSLFTDMPRVDLIATKGDEILAINLKRHGPQKDTAVIVAEGKTSHDYSLSLLKEAESLQRPETRRAALLMAWTAFEAAAREVMSVQGQDYKKSIVASPIQSLLKAGLIEPGEVERLREGMLLRNALAHGLQPTEVSPDIITFLLEIVRRLKHPSLADNLRLYDSVSVTVIRNNLNREPELRDLVTKATKLLDEVLGNSRGLVSVDWDLGEDGDGRRVLALKLSDFSGIVTGTFVPEELERPNHMRTRLFRLWGDLLQIRNSKQLESITGVKNEGRYAK